MLRNADFSSFKAVYVVCGRTDMRLGINGLSAIIESRFHLPLFIPDTLFLFCGRKSSLIKGLLWEGDGFLMLVKRVEEGRFSWPRNSEELRALTREQFQWLMQGFSIDPPIVLSSPKRSA